MKRNKVNSIINISGLAIAIASVIFIVMWVKDELGYDVFFKEADHIFQVNMTINDKGVTNTTGGNTAPAVTPTMLSIYPEIESYVRIYRPGDILVRYKESPKEEYNFTEHNLWAVDSNFLQVFNFPLLYGDAKSCLQNANAVVITEATAKKYFGSTTAVGRLLSLDIDKKPFIVTGVLKNIPSQSSFQFDILAPIQAYEEVKKRSWNWFWLQVNSYVKLKSTIAVDKISIAKLEAKFPEMIKDYAFDERYSGTYEEFVKKGNQLAYSLLPFTRVHLYATPLGTPARLNTLSDIKYIYIFSAIAFFIILLACVNFMNLSTAQSATRAKEVGVRKVLGSEKKQLIKQFLSEAIVYSVISTLLALLLVSVSIRAFNSVSGKSLEFGSIFSTTTGLFVLGLCLFTGLLAGAYPAFYLTSFNPITVLKGIKIFKNNVSNLFIRNGLVVFQFAISIALIICTIIVFQQLKFTQNKNMGLNKENILEIANTRLLGNHENTFRQELTKQSYVIDAAISGSIPTKDNFGDGYNPEETDTDKALIKDIGLASFMVDEHFIPTMKMQIQQGRNFSKAFNDSATVILNETAAKQIGWKQPVGKYLDYPGNDQKFKVIGIVKDFNITSLRSVIEPFALFHTSSNTYSVNSSFVSVRLKSDNINNDVANIKKIWKAFAPETPFDYSFLDEEFDALYRSEHRMSAVFSIFTFLSILVACLGLLGLSIYTSERRKKEIGVRKVLGASVQSIVRLLSKDFLKLVIVSAIIAFPVAWIAMNRWLEDFAYRITISWIVFVVAAVAALLIAMITISFQSFKAAIANPVNSLRTE